MVRTSRFIATSFAATIAAWQPCVANAAEKETQLWMMYDASVPLGDRTDLTLLAMPHLRESQNGDDLLILRATINHTIGDAVKAGGGLSYVVGLNSFQPFQQVELSRGGFALRLRLAEITCGGADRLGLRQRVRLRYKARLDSGTSATLSGEWFYTMRSAKRDRQPARDQLRLAAAIRHNLGARLHMGIGYTLIATPARGHRPTRIIHAPLLTAGYNF